MRGAALPELLGKTLDRIGRERLERSVPGTPHAGERRLQRLAIEELRQKRARSCRGLLMGELAHIEHRHARHQPHEDQERKAKKPERARSGSSSPRR